MYKKFPILFPDLLADFELIKGSSDDPDATDYEMKIYFLNLFSLFYI